MALGDADELVLDAYGLKLDVLRKTCAEVVGNQVLEMQLQVVAALEAIGFQAGDAHRRR